VALYFAVCDSRNEDGELWCMDHGELNWRSADWRACFPDTPPVQYLAAAAFLKEDDLANFSYKLGPLKHLNGPLAMIPPFPFRRMAAQMSRFTIHISKEPEAQLDFLLRGNSLVVMSFQPTRRVTWRIIWRESVSRTKRYFTV
jgi:hypothetical protein